MPIRKQIVKKMQFIVRMCDFELKCRLMLLIFKPVLNDNISGIRSVDIVIKMLLVFYFCLFPCFLVLSMILHFQLFLSIQKAEIYFDINCALQKYLKHPYILFLHVC